MKKPPSAAVVVGSAALALAAPAAAVDHINTDDLAGLEEYLTEDPADIPAWPAWAR